MALQVSMNFMSEYLAHQIQANLEILKSEGSTNKIIIPYMEGDPGCGKTSIVDQVAAVLGGRVEVLRLADRLPTDVAGWTLPNAERTRMTRIVPDWMADPKEHLVILFLDELPQGVGMCQNVAAQIVNERRVGPYDLPPNMVVVAAGNPPKARAGTSTMPTHLRDRLTFFHIQPDFEGVTRYFQTIDCDARVIGYLRHRPDMLSKFDKDAQACPSPRSWERVSGILESHPPRHLAAPAIMGTVGEEAGTDFMAYLKLAKDMPDIDNIIANPDSAPIPQDMGIMYAVAAALAPRINKETDGAIIKYLRRLPRKEISAFVVSDAMARTKVTKELPAVNDWLLKEGREILLS